MILSTLLIIYGALALINLVFMLVLHFLHDRTGYYRTAAVVWTGVFLSFFMDGFLSTLDGPPLNHILGIPFIGISMFSLAKLACDIYKFELPFKKLFLFSFLTWTIGAILHLFLNARFEIASLVICLGIVAPAIWGGFKVFKSTQALTILDKLFGAILIAEAIHILDYPFLRLNEGLAVYGFSLGILLIYIVSMLIPVVINRRLGADLNETLELKVQERTKQLLETREKLVNSAKFSALGEMAGGIAHEINTPLAVIGLLGEQTEELLARDQLDRDELLKMMKTTGETVKKISTIVQGLRMFAREGGQDPFIPESVNRIVESTLVLCQERIKHGKIALQIADIPSDYKIQCRPVQISQVLLNLISNSCDAIAQLPERWIKIEAQKKGQDIRILITDSGSGISEEVQRKIFQPFFTTKDIGKGTGLGLSISKGIMEIHKGNLSLDPQCENTRFFIDCPAASV